MHLVGAHRLEHRVGPGATGHPRPRHSSRSPETNTFDAVCGGTSVAKAIGSARSVTAPSMPCTRNLYRPPGGKPGQNNSHPRRAERPHRGVGAVPAVELPDQADALGVRGPTANDTPRPRRRGGERTRMGAEDLPEPFVAALGEQVQVDLTEGGKEPVSIGDRVDDRAAVGTRVANLDR